MKLDQYSNPIFQEQDIFDLLYNGQIDSLEHVIFDNSPELANLKELANLASLDVSNIDYSVSVEEFDKQRQSEWFMPDAYKNFDVYEFCLSCCSNEVEKIRTEEELQAFESRGMIPLLQMLKYMIDTFRENKILWGVGRGSSVSSYVLFLLGVHKIDSIKYNLDWRDFLR